jgi:hypothetical protein
MITTQPKRAHVVVICQLDRYANGLKPIEIERFLSRRGHRVQLVNTYHLSRAKRASKLPNLRPRRFVLYLTELLTAVNRRWDWGRGHLSYYLAVADFRLRARILASSLPLDDADLVICETPYDAGVLVGGRAARTLYDCPTPWADELFHEGRLTQPQRDRLRRLETELFETVDYLTFHWQTYADYAVRHYGITGRNLLTCNFGCTPSPTRARFAERPRIAYLGSLGSRFIDLPLLSRLTAQYADIDVYGGPPPDPALGLNYRGYAEPDVLLSYQAGLITCTKDELRRQGFSAKHLQYLAYGMPVLVPEWRRHIDLLRGSVPYSEANFQAVVASLSDESTWRQLSDQAYGEAERRRWDRCLMPLENLLTGLEWGAGRPTRSLADPDQPSRLDPTIESIDPR